MRLWHEAMLGSIDGNRLVRQHCECCALRGNGWGRKHATVDYVFTHPYVNLVRYHYKVYEEMKRRGYNFDTRWLNPSFRGDSCLGTANVTYKMLEEAQKQPGLVYEEHDDEYACECIANLYVKGVDISKYMADEDIRRSVLEYMNRYGIDYKED